jgi:hypothetical protein
MAFTLLQIFIYLSCSVAKIIVKVKVKGHPITGHDGPTGGVEV